MFIGKSKNNMYKISYYIFILIFLSFNSFGQSFSKPYPNFTKKDTIALNVLRDYDDIQLALNKINKVIRDNPNNLMAYYVRGLFYGQSDKYDAAISDFSYVLKNNISNWFRSWALMRRSGIYYINGEYTKGYTDAKKSIELGDDSELTSQIVKDYEAKNNDLNINQLENKKEEEEETVIVFCPYCIKGKPTITGHYDCPNCINWNAEYRRKVPCHICKDTRKISNGKCGICNGKKNIKITRLHYNQFKDVYVLFKKQTSK